MLKQNDPRQIQVSATDYRKVSFTLYIFIRLFFFYIIFTCDDVAVTLYILTLNFSQQKLGTGSALKTCSDVADLSNFTKCTSTK